MERTRLTRTEALQMLEPLPIPARRYEHIDLGSRLSLLNQPTLSKSMSATTPLRLCLLPATLPGVVQHLTSAVETRTRATPQSINSSLIKLRD